MNEGVLVMEIKSPMVPEGQGRIRMTITAIHSKDQMEKAIQCLAKHAEELGVLKKT